MLDRLRLCLVGTSSPENLGAVARLLENFGIDGLTLVTPRVAREDPRALVVGRTAIERLSSARVAGDLDEAIAECSWVVGLSARRGSDRPEVELRSLVPLLSARAPTGSIALVFGPEDTGLRREHIDRCDALCYIDADGSLASFNLAQAVGIVLWELARASRVATTPPSTTTAPRAEVEALLDHVLALLDAIGYLRTRDPERQRTQLRRLLSAASLSSKELRTLHGICAQVLHQSRNSSPMP